MQAEKADQLEDLGAALKGTTVSAAATAAVGGDDDGSGPNSSRGDQGAASNGRDGIWLQLLQRQCGMTVETGFLLGHTLAGSLD